ncbi:hypothetical protein EC968_009214 [Mortierella alpina]|nr:hypothetical protein EC968_009214 [Mortierella alpina]
MSLYGDLPPPSTSASADGPSKKAEGDAKEGTAASGAAKSVLPAGWSSSITRLKPMLNRKLAPPKARPAQRTIPAGFVAQPVQESHKEVTATKPGTTAVSPPVPGHHAVALSSGTQHVPGNILDENSWLKARTAQVQRNDNDVHSMQRKPEFSSPPGQNRGVTILNDTSGEDAFLRRAQLTQQRLSEQASTPSLPSTSSAPIHQSAQDYQQNQPYSRPAFTPKAAEQTARKGSPSPVILLTNMVGPGEVDDTLQEETAMECEKFGPVVRCLIFEVQNGKVPPEEAVRIFVKFGSLISAEKALKDLDGRFFGGRQVRGQFFDEKRFDSLQLAP